MNDVLNRIRHEYKNPMAVFSSVTRSMLVASPGKELFCADWAAVEARIAFWVAEHDEGLEAFRQDRKLYEEMASEGFNIPIELVTKDSIERFVGKESVLGCQYGMGGKKFLAQCHKKGVKQVTEEMAKRAVAAYRALHHPVPTLWRNMENAAIRAISNPGRAYKTNKVTLYTRGDFLNIQLPSGRKMRYFKPSLRGKRLLSGHTVPEIRYWAVDLHEWKEVTTWGGILTNHVVQGIARDLMVNAIYNLENAGYEFLLSVHDEGLSEREVGVGSLDEYLEIFTKLPPWAGGLPIKAEGWIGRRYRK